MSDFSTSLFPAVIAADHQGCRWMFFEREAGVDMALQGVMRLAMPNQIELTYVQQMMMWLLFNESPKKIVQLGLGSAALTKFCYRHFPKAEVIAVELNPNVIDICRRKIYLPPDDARLSVLAMDANVFVNDPLNHATIDVLQVDLYDAKALAPALGSVDFYAACAACLTENGMMTVNLYCDGNTASSAYAANLQAMQANFDAVVWLPEVHDANVIALAFKRAPSIDFVALYERASDIRRMTKLPAAYWVNGLKEWMAA